MRSSNRNAVRYGSSLALGLCLWMVGLSGCSGDAGGAGQAALPGATAGVVPTGPGIAPVPTAGVPGDGIGGVPSATPGVPIGGTPTIVPETPAGITGREGLAVRLTRQQYSNTVADLLGVELTEEELEAIPADATHEAHFITWAEGQNFSSDHVVGYSELARLVASRVDAGQIVGQWASCSDVSPACGTAVTQALSSRLFRRPPAAEEQASMEALFTSVGSFDGAAFGDAAAAVLRAFLQSPQFLYRLEAETGGVAGETRSITGHELATRLSYFLWQSSPDDSLRRFGDQVATTGVLDEAALAAEVDRMLADPRSLRSEETFWADYTLASQATYQDAGDLAEDLRRTVLATVRHMTGTDGVEKPLSQLFLQNQMVLSEDLAADMGLASQGPGDQVYDLTGTAERVGLLTHPGFVAAIGTTSFVGRGKYLSERILCHQIASPNLDDPAFQEQLDDAANETRDDTPREAMDYRFGLMGACLACHQTFEPIAMAFEQFDVNGSFTPQDDEGRDLFSHGYLQGPGGNNIGDYNSVGELMQLLADREETTKCLVKNQLSFASGQSSAVSDNPAVDQAHAAFIAAGGTYSALVRAIAVSPQLRTLKVAAAQ